MADFQRAPHHPLYFHDDLTWYDYGAALFVDFLVHRDGLEPVKRVFRAGDHDFVRTLDAALAPRGGLDAALRDFARCRVRTGRYADSACFAYVNRQPTSAYSSGVAPWGTFHPTGLPSRVAS